MRRITLILIIFSLVSSLGLIGYKIYYEKTKPVADKTRDINVLLEKDKNWRKIVQEQHFTPATFPKIDGSTAMIPMTMEFVRQHLTLNESEVKSYAQHSRTHEAYVNLINKQVDIIFVSEQIGRASCRERV